MLIATFSDQSALLRCVDQEEVRGVVSKIPLSPFLRNLFNVHQLLANGRELGMAMEYFDS